MRGPLRRAPAVAGSAATLPGGRGAGARAPWLRLHSLSDRDGEPHPPPLRRLLSLALDVRGVTVAQFPNAPLAVSFVASLVAGMVHGTPHAVALAVSMSASALWAYLELVSGASWFRRLLGAEVAVRLAIHLIGLGV